MERGGTDLLSQADSHSNLTAAATPAPPRLEQARQRVLEPSHTPLALFRGLPWAVKLGPDSGVVEFSVFSTLRSTHSCPPGGKGYYEVEILGLDSVPQLRYTRHVMIRLSRYE